MFLEFLRIEITVFCIIWIAIECLFANELSLVINGYF